ncbi:MAG: phosphotransferase, partial [Deltaproteobacteria bacterium]|nr:phosphotransferase [Deltaproteobacteria bacterium]
MKPWDAEHRADLDLAKRLIEIQFPNLKPANLKLLGEGWDNLAYEVNQKFVFRFPRRQISVDLIRTESEVLPSVAPRLPLPIPNPIYLGQPTKDYPWPFAGYKMLEG